MADSKFNVKNTSLRVVHFGGKMIVPGKVVAIDDDELGINRATLEGDQFLEETDEDVSDPVVTEDEPVAKPAKKEKATANAKTPTGAGWANK